jgi:hypothetical protein
MTTVLKEAKNLASSSSGEQQRIVRLSENYSDYELSELLVRMSSTQVIFTKLDDTEDSYDEDGDHIRTPSKNYTLTAAEADAFCKAWLTYKIDRAVALEAEETRKAGVLVAAHKLASELGMEITTGDEYDGETQFKLKHPHRHVSHSYTYGADGLLSTVQEFQAELEEERKTIVEAREVANKITALCGDTIGISSKKPSDGYYNLKIDGRFSHCSTDQFHAETLLNRLQTILRDLEREQTQKVQAGS